MPKIDENCIYPVITFNQSEYDSIADFVITKQRKKKLPPWTYQGKELINGVSAEMGEHTVDLLMEALGMDRIWMRGQFHYDFSDLQGKNRIEVKTRKKYAPFYDDLDVRIDYDDTENIREANYLVPLIYDDRYGDSPYAIISPGVIKVTTFYKGIVQHAKEIPPVYTLKKPCHRATWGMVKAFNKDFGYYTWAEYKALYTGV